MPVGFKRRYLRAIKRLYGFLSWLFVVQLQVVNHPSRRKAVLTPRRAGKTEMACVWLLDQATRNPGKKFLYICLTRPNAKDIAWGIFRKLNRTFNLRAHFHDSDLEIRLPNGSIIMLRGADQENWIERLEGQEFLLIVVDESGLYSINIRKLIYDALSPMVDSCGGTICLIGRPGIVKSGLFWDITRPDLRMKDKDADGAWSVVDNKGGKEWAIFNWSTFDNPYVTERWRAEIEEKLRINPDLVNEPGFRRNYLGEWAEDTEGLVYAFEDVRNTVDDYQVKQGDQFGCATDFGWDDAQAFVIGCWSQDMPELVILESFKQSHMPLSDALARLQMYRERYPGLLMWGDPARKQLYMEMAIRFGEGTVVNPAEKEAKADNIELMNNDYALGMIKIVRPTNQPLIAELGSLRRMVKTTIVDAALNEERGGRWIEHPRMANDCCDCALYLWRHSRHYRYKEQVMGPPPGTPEYADKMARELWEGEQDRAAKRERREWWRRN